MEKELIREVLSSENNDIDKAAKTLGMSKSNLEKKIQTYEL